MKNILQVIVRNDTFLFYANGMFLTEVKDTTYTDGDIGFLASTTTVGTKANVVYSNLKVYSQQ